MDFVVGTCLTIPGAETARVDGRAVQAETDLEIVAKKLYFRGHQLKARDLFDLAMLLDKDPAIATALSQWADRHRPALRSGINSSAMGLRTVFEAIDATSYRTTFEEALARVRNFLDRPSQPNSVVARKTASRAKPKK